MAKVDSLPENGQLGPRIHAIEVRFGKEFTEVLADLVDHVFGTTPVPSDDAPAPEGGETSGESAG